jgi:hypothetical protein
LRHDLDVRGDRRAQPARERLVDLHRHDARAALGEREGEGAFAGTDLQEHVTRGGGDHLEELLDRLRAEEVLSEPAGHGGRVAEKHAPRVLA